MADKYILTPEQETKVLEAWNDLKFTDLKKIIEHVFGEGFDGRSKQGLATKGFLASRNLKAKASQEYAPVRPELKLTPEQEQYIIRHAKDGPTIIARDLFNDPTINNLRKEYLLVKSVWDSLDPSDKIDGYDPDVNKKYMPPTDIKKALARVNKFTNSSLEFEKLNQKEKDCLTRLMKYCKTWRFVAEMDILASEKDTRGISEREFLEAQFIKWTWDKPDLTEEDIDIYITVGLQYVQTNKLRKRWDMLSNEFESQMDDEDKTLKMTLVEALTALEKQIKDNEEAAKKTLQQLNGLRDNRLKENQGRNLSISTLVELVKNKEKRDKIANLMRKRKDKLREEMRELSTMDALMFEMFGLGDIEGI